MAPGGLGAERATRLTSLCFQLDRVADLFTFSFFFLSDHLHTYFITTSDGS